MVTTLRSWLAAGAGLTLIAGAVASAPKPVKPTRKPAPVAFKLPPPNARSVIIRGITLVDGTDTPPLPNAALLVREGRIAAAGKLGSFPIPKDAFTVHATGKTAVPGLIDMHTHSTVHPSLQLYFLANGVTSIRDLGSAEDKLAELVAYRKAVEAGTQVGPRLFFSGPPIDGHPRAANWFPGPSVTDEESGRKAVNRLADAGVDCIKLYRRLPPRLAKPIIEEAHRRNLPVTWDYQWNYRYLMDACLAEPDGLEHVFYNERFSRDEAGQLEDMIVNRRIWFEPTLVAFRPQETPVTQDAAFQDLPPSLTKFWGNLFWPQETPQEFEWMKSLVRHIHQKGGRILAGTDTPVKYVAPGYGIHHELQLLTECRLTPTDALRCATRNAAEALRREKDLGTLERGKLADLLLVDGDPTKDIRALRKIALVMQGGRSYTPAALLRQAKALPPVEPPKVPGREAACCQRTPQELAAH